jgi:4-diphosphocytidyl-2C-methyl-D-erythritol kinase
MTGSGATIFGVFDSEAAAREAAGQMRESVGDSDPTWIRVSRLIGQD